MNLGTAQIIQGNALALPLPDASVDLICTSPPYFGLRSYQDNGQHYDGQIGSEATPTEFLDALIAATREMVRVLKPSGSIFVNLGDKYAMSSPVGAGGKGAASIVQGKGSNLKANLQSDRRRVSHGVRDKSLVGIPWRYAIACIDDLGLILRAEIIWNKPNGLPESVTDRVRRSHEQWFHFTVQPRYFAAVDEIREPHLVGFNGSTFGGKTRNGVRVGSGERSYGHNTYDELNPLGKLPGSVWTIPTQPLTVPPELGIDHFAAYPMEFPRRIIQGWTPNGVCTVCGQGRAPQRAMNWDNVPHRMELRRNREPTQPERAEFSQWFRGERFLTGLARADFVPHFPHYKNAESVKAQISNWELGKNIPMPSDMRIIETILGQAPQRICEIVGEMAMMPVMAEAIAVGPEGSGRHRNTMRNRSDVHSITGYVCGCPDATAPTTPAVVLDPFMGTGTTLLVARALGRNSIGVDLSADYCRLAEWRCNDPRELAAALQVEKPEPVHPDQLDLFDEAT